MPGSKMVVCKGISSGWQGVARVFKWLLECSGWLLECSEV